MKTKIVWYTLSLLFAIASYAEEILIPKDLSSTLGYENIAQDYDRGRPDYPEALLPLLVEVLDLKEGTRVLDLAAGSGKVTKALKSLSVHLLAVEPVEEMRSVFQKNFPDISIVEGFAENIPLETESIDVVVVGTAFHWFDQEKALNEIARVLKPKGRLCMIWNCRAMELGWVKEVSDALDDPEKRKTHDKMEWRGAFENHPLFHALHHQTYSYAYPGTKEDVLARLFSSKLMGTLPEERKREVIAHILKILTTHPDTRGKEAFDIPYRVEIYWCEKKN